MRAKRLLRPRRSLLIMPCPYTKPGGTGRDTLAAADEAEVNETLSRPLEYTNFHPYRLWDRTYGAKLRFRLEAARELRKT
jgi:hypothetical protein